MILGVDSHYAARFGTPPLTAHRLTLYGPNINLNHMADSVDPRRLRITSDDGMQGTLIGFRCQDCGVSVFGPATFCQSCTSFEVEPADLGADGTLYSYTIVRIPPAGWPGQVPYILGQVELPSGPQVLAEVIDCQQEDLTIGMPVELAIRAVAPEEGGAEKLVYKWRPAT